MGWRAEAGDHGPGVWARDSLAGSRWMTRVTMRINQHSWAWVGEATSARSRSPFIEQMLARKGMAVGWVCISSG